MNEIRDILYTKTEGRVSTHFRVNAYEGEGYGVVKIGDCLPIPLERHPLEIHSRFS
jgi:hypothetical protein